MLKITLSAHILGVNVEKKEWCILYRDSHMVKVRSDKTRCCEHTTGTAGLMSPAGVPTSLRISNSRKA